MYGQNPSGILDLTPIPHIGRLSIKADDMTDYLHGIHAQVKEAIEENNVKYKTQSDNHRCKVTFEVGDLVWDVLTHDHFTVGEYNKLQERKVGPCEVMQKINDNAYRLRLPSHLKTSDVFNVKHLTPCLIDATSDSMNLRASSFQPGETDVEGSINVELSNSELMALEYLDREDLRKKGKDR